jgi:hypothetical protein
MDLFRQLDMTTVRLSRVNEALSDLDEYEAQVLLPEDLRQPALPPELDRPALKAQQRMLCERIGLLEEQIRAHYPFSTN